MSTAPPTAMERWKFLGATAIAGVVLGLAGGFVWDRIASPPSALVTPDGVFLAGEISYDAQVVVTLWYLVVGLVGGLLAGLVVAVAARRFGWWTLAGVVLLSAVASGVGAWTGIHVFGPDLDSQVADAKPGDEVTTALSIGSKVAYLGWPIGGLAGAVTGIALWPREEKAHDPTPLSSNVVGPEPTLWGD